MRTSLFFALVVVACSACGAVRFTQAGTARPARLPSCDFEIFTILPAGYAEVGTIDISPAYAGANIERDLTGFKKQIAPKVCAAGGDAALASANGYGMYLKATVLKRDASAPTGEASPAPASSGCQFDTQCKGERICVSGACVDPQHQ
jgi:hypothetical protein